VVGVILDTNVLSELFRPSPNPQVIATLRPLAPETVYVSVLTMGELRNGVSLLSPGSRRDDVRRFADQIERDYRDRLLDIDVNIAQIWGEITARGKLSGRQIPTIDGLIAATALRHGLSVMTRNADHFEVAGVSVINPWQDAAS
jgi:predicted nucleic acid-binding protein